MLTVEGYGFVLHFSEVMPFSLYLIQPTVVFLNNKTHYLLYTRFFYQEQHSKTKKV